MVVMVERFCCSRSACVLGMARPFFAIFVSHDYFSSTFDVSGGRDITVFVVMPIYLE